MIVGGDLLLLCNLSTHLPVDEDDGNILLLSSDFCESMIALVSDSCCWSRVFPTGDDDLGCIVDGVFSVEPMSSRSIALDAMLFRRSGFIAGRLTS